jgi:hypothetical protein
VNVTPKTSDLFDEIAVRVAIGSEGLWVECAVIAPESALGRTVHLYLPDEVSEALLKVFRRRAIYRRREPLSEPESLGTVTELRPEPRND